MNQLSAKPLLVVVAKEPIPGKVKTRLFPALTFEEAAALYQCMIEDRIQEVVGINDIDLAIAFTPAGARNAFIPFARNGITLFAQRGKNLGERLLNIFIDKLSAGYPAVSIVDSDTPDLPASAVVESFRLLLAEESDVVFGPCHDGGYYLVGMRNPHPELFTDIPWSTENVLKATLKKTGEMSLKTELLDWWDDLDTVEDLMGYYKKYSAGTIINNKRGRKTQTFLSSLKIINQFRVGSESRLTF